MIEKFNIPISYSKFLAVCSPAYCTYTVTERRNIIALISTLLGVFSGLNVAMKLIVPLVMRPLYQLSIGARRMYITIFLLFFITIKIDDKTIYTLVIAIRKKRCFCHILWFNN